MGTLVEGPAQSEVSEEAHWLGLFIRLLVGLDLAAAAEDLPPAGPKSQQSVKLTVCASAVPERCTLEHPEDWRTRKPAHPPCCREIERASGLRTQLCVSQSCELLAPVAGPLAPSTPSVFPTPML